MIEDDKYLGYLARKRIAKKRSSFKYSIKNNGTAAAKKEAMVEAFLTKETGLLKDILRLSKSPNVGVGIKTISLLIKKRFGVELSSQDYTPLALYLVARGCKRKRINSTSMILGCYVAEEYRDANMAILHYSKYTMFIHKSFLPVNNIYKTCPNCGAIKLEKTNASEEF